MGVMKYFRHILIEIFFKIFDEPQNIFFMFYFRNFIFQVDGVGAKNIQTSHQEDLRKIRNVK